MGSGFKDFAAGDVLTAADVDGYLMRQTAMTFADTSARDSALSGVLDEGMLAYAEDTNLLTFYDGSNWQDIAAASSIGTWTTYTPTVTSGTGTITSYTSAGDYCRVNDFVVVQFEANITDNGTGASDVRVSLPITAASAVGNPNIGGAIEDAIGGFYVQIQLASGVGVCRQVNYLYPGGTGRRLRGTMTYKAA